MNSARYTFGSTSAAAQRLEEISRFFNPLAKAWISKYLQGPGGTVVDLGCGPGFSTDMLSGALSGADVYGLEKSDEFLQMARQRFPGCTFIRHDVTRGPLPIKADVSYCRFLLSHLRDIEAHVNAWTDSLTPGGMLFLDETEGINTDIPAFRRYLEINDALIGSQGAELFVGERLSKCSFKAEVLSNELFRIPVASWRAATWFYPNTVSVWESEKYVLDNYAAKVRQELSEVIREIMVSKDASVKTLWKMRRIVLKKKENNNE